jgi:hypothetical protein
VLGGSPIGTAMLSYAEHGKFRALLQAPRPVGRPVLAKMAAVVLDPGTGFCNVPLFKWIMGCAGAQWRTAAPSPQYQQKPRRSIPDCAARNPG